MWWFLLFCGIICLLWNAFVEYWWVVLLISPIIFLVRKEMKEEKIAKEWEEKIRLADKREKEKQELAKREALEVKARAERIALEEKERAERFALEAATRAELVNLAEFGSMIPVDPVSTSLGDPIRAGDSEEEKYNALCEINLLMWAARAVSEYHTINDLRQAVSDSKVKSVQRCKFEDDAAVAAAIYRTCRTDPEQGTAMIPKLVKLNFLIPNKGKPGYTARLTANEFAKFSMYHENNLRIAQGLESKYDRADYDDSVVTNFPPDMDTMSGEEFESFCVEILENNGFTDVSKTVRSGDHGVDILAQKDGIIYAIQCKCYSSTVGNAAVQQVYSGKGLYNADIAVIMTNSTFSRQAKADADKLRVKLWDREKLLEMQ